MSALEGIYRFEFRPYQRQFKSPLQTSHGTWDVREGIILRLMDETGQIGCGEIAPIPWFGSESLEKALDFCRKLPDKITAETIFYIPSVLPACQFGFESAWETIKEDKKLAIAHSFPIASLSGLLPAGEAALQAWQPLWQQGYHTFKWKIGVVPIKDELKIFNQLIHTLPFQSQLRLDANGGLSWEQAKEWLRVCDNNNVEFIEQPLAVDRFDAMLELSAQHSTLIALDESVATLPQLQAAYQKGWRGIFVIKAAIAGSPKLLRQFCQQHQIDAVFSSVFETAIGRQAALKLAGELSRHNRALGFGINHWFNEDDQTCLGRLWKDH